MDNQNHLKPIARRKNPSFSSSLLDQIYRSFDDQTTPAARGAEKDHLKTEDHYRIGKEMDQNAGMMLLSKADGRRKSATAECHFSQSFGLNSCSTSSDSSFWTSSESETSQRSFGQSKMAVRTSFSTHYQQQQEDQEGDRIYASQRNERGGFVKAESKALKMYGELKKSKANQPVSPGSRLSSFLNSLFTSTGNAKKAKIDKRKYASVNASSACSSTRSSCFSKTPSSRGKLSDGVKRSVRFYPLVSVIMDEDRKCKDIGRHTYDNVPTRNSLCAEEIRERENNRRAREVLKNYEKKLEEFKMMNKDEDCESCASSDLFELDNLDSVTAIRQRYSQELPVYETTSLDANRAIAHGANR
ncbi:Corepressor interacting with RBPJ 1-like [Heracleum sosnowskyi]|uniref:Corepressor interacting with RBPJ 1-like n=1 Tax=Heracleum sosnowskyi TaxID=360622 RepID=A0AAD8H131_9APIA|nr:Corepressor interacting with RBPJ 1-like [Heracleum sosnowskyi]